MNATLLHDLRVIFRRFEENGASASAVVIRDAMQALSAAPQSATPEVLLSQGWLDIGHERTRQVAEEGWSAEHDDIHSGGELAMAASCYAELAAVDDQRRHRHAHGLATFMRWPWAQAWWKPKSRRHDLVRAGALIVAEIERLDRQAARELEGVSGRLA